jgi:hypothetical protein
MGVAQGAKGVVETTPNGYWGRLDHPMELATPIFFFFFVFLFC